VSTAPEGCEYNPPHPLIGRTVRNRQEPSKGNAARASPSQAARWLSSQCGFSGEGIRGIVRAAVSDAAKQGKDGDLGPQAIAELMLARWKAYREDYGLMRYVWGPGKFFEMGHWREDAAWPYDQTLVHRRHESQLGTHRRRDADTDAAATAETFRQAEALGRRTVQACKPGSGG
jgi:hypothetical protein